MMVHIDADMCDGYLDGQPLGLTPTEYRLLCRLAQRPGLVVRHGELSLDVLGRALAPETRAEVRYYVARLRRRGVDVASRRGFGYSLRLEGAA